MLKEHGFTGETSALALGISRSTFYYDSRKDDSEERNEIRRLAFKNKRDGYRMIYHQMRAHGWSINHKKVYRIYREEGLKIRQKLRKKKYPGASEPLPVPEKPDHTWAGDFLHTTLYGGRKVKIFNSIDLCTRRIPVLFADYSIGGEVLKTKLERIFESESLPDFFVFDNGPEFRSRAMEEWSARNEVHLHFIDPGKPTQNAFVESLNGTIRQELLNYNWFYTLDELRAALENWRNYYNSERLHSSLGYRTPNDHREKLLLTENTGKTNI